MKNLPESIQIRQSDISVNKEMFKKAAGPNNAALKENGYKHIVKYTPNYVATCMSLITHLKSKPHKIRSKYEGSLAHSGTKLRVLLISSSNMYESLSFNFYT